jgi:transposase-like protein
MSLSLPSDDEYQITSYQQKVAYTPRRSFPVHERLRAVNMYLDDGKKIKKTASKLNISPTSLRRCVIDFERLKREPRTSIRSGSGRKPFAPELDKRVKYLNNSIIFKINSYKIFILNKHKNYVSYLRQKKNQVTRHMLYQKAVSLAKELGLDNFKCSRGYLANFLERSQLSYRKPTHVAQQNTKTKDVQLLDVVEYLNSLNSVSSQYDTSLILNMDETPIYFDANINKTLDEIGKKSIDVVNSRSGKTRLTCVITIAADGLKKVPKCNIPANIVVNVSSSGSMDTTLMLDYMEKIILPYTKSRKALLVMDEFGAHKTLPVLVKYYLNKCDQTNIDPLMIPGGYTHCLQPLDVVINKPFKDNFRVEWDDWMVNSEPIFTKSGNRQKPAYECVFNMLSKSLQKINTNMVSKSFTVCGLFVNRSLDIFALNR